MAVSFEPTILIVGALWCHSKAQSWCGFKDPRSQKGSNWMCYIYIKAYIQVHSLILRQTTEKQLKPVIDFADTLDPVKLHIQFIKKKYHSDDLKQVQHQLRTLVKNTARNRVRRWRMTLQSEYPVIMKSWD